MEIDEVIRKIAIYGIIIILSYTMYCIIKNTNMSVTIDSIRFENNPTYPDTNNPIMYGVTMKEYTAEIKK